MKPPVVLGLCILLGSSLVAKAELITVSQTRSVFNGTYDKVVLNVTGITGSDVPTGTPITGLEGTWTLPAGGYFYLNSSAATWPAKLSNDADAQDVAGPETWLDFGNYNSANTHSRGGQNGSNNNQWNAFTISYNCDPSIYGTYYNYFIGPTDYTPGNDGSGNAGAGFDNTLLAVLYVTHATPDLSGKTIFSGTGDYALPLGGGAQSGIATTLQVVGVPEPSILALLGCGLMGLLAYVWRKRQ